jgi:hypothetical protein
MPIEAMLRPTPDAYQQVTAMTITCIDGVRPEADDAVAAMEADIDRRMRKVMSQAAYASMLANRRALASEPQPERVVRVAAPATDEAVAGMLTSLMGVCYVEAMRSLDLAARATVPGASIEPRRVAIGEAAKLARAMAMLSDALSRRQGKAFEQKIVVQYVNGGQAVGMVNREGAVAGIDLQ